MSPANGTASAPLARNDYREGQVLRARDLERESGYFLARDRQHAALAHVPGILRGLQLRVFEAGTENAVTPDDLAKKGPLPLDLFVEAGVAVDGYGRLVGVPRREQLRAELATAPSLLREGRYRVELLYDRRADSAGGGRGGDACASAGLGGAGGRTVRETYRVRLVRADEALASPDVGAVLDGPPDAPEAEAPVALGTVDWNGTGAFVGFSLQGRVYAGVRAETVLAPDERAELDLRDPGGRVALRFAPEAAPGEAPHFADAVRVDDQGSVWVRGDLDVGPDGIRFRRDPGAEVRSLWEIHLHSEAGSRFGKKPGQQPGEEEPLVAPEYAAGERELRVVFERADAEEGRRRVVVGHVDRQGDEFRPAVIVYDRPPDAPEKGASTVEVWGDLFVRGTTHVTGVQRIPASGRSESDELDILLRQLAGPLAGAFRAFLLSDPEWLDDLGGVLAERIPDDPGFVSAVTDELRGTQSFIDAVAGEAADEVAQALTSDNNLLNALVLRLRNNAQFVGDLSAQLRNDAQLVSAVAQAATGSVAQALRTNNQFVADIANAVAVQIAGNQTTAQAVTAAVVQRIAADSTTAQTLADALAPELNDSQATARAVADAVTLGVSSDGARATALRNALGIP